MEWLQILVVGLVVLVCTLLMHFGMRSIHGSHGSEHMARAHDAGANTTERLHQLELENT